MLHINKIHDENKFSRDKTLDMTWIQSANGHYVQVMKLVKEISHSLLIIKEAKMVLLNLCIHLYLYHLLITSANSLDPEPDVDTVMVFLKEFFEKS